MKQDSQRECRCAHNPSVPAQATGAFAKQLTKHSITEYVVNRDNELAQYDEVVRNAAEDAAIDVVSDTIGDIASDAIDLL